MRHFASFLALLSMLAAAPAMAIETAAKQAFMIDTSTHSVLLEKSADEKMHPSSMSKLMTLYVLFDRLKQGKLKLEDTFPISKKAWSMQGSKTFLHVGDQVSIEDLLHGIIIQSGNDACIVVAEGISGSEEAFVSEMNQVGKEIGLQNSHFTNATGWPDDYHLMSARDLAILSERLINDFPEYYHYFSLTEYTYNKITQANRNRLLGAGIGVDGLKTGHTEAAGYGIALSAKQGDRRLILVINGLESDNQRVEEGKQLLQHGFRDFENKTVLKAGQPVADVDVWFGKKATVPVMAANDVVLTLPIAGQKDTGFALKYNGPVAAPIEQGAQIANLIITAPGRQPQTVPLVAAEPVEKLSGFSKVWAIINYYIFKRSVPAS